MTQFFQFVLDISESFRTNKISDKLKKAGYDFRTADKSSGEQTYITSVPAEDAHSTNIACKEFEDHKIVVKYYNDCYDEADMIFTISESGINFSFRGEDYENIEKDEYFNLTMCFSKKMISFDYIKEIHENLNKLEGMTLFYAQDEELEYGYA